MSKSMLDPIVRIDRSVKPTYPDWVKDVLHPELEATVRDRILHHAIYRVLYPFFDRIFIADSYSCRKGKGTHKAMNRFLMFARKESRNNTHTCFVLKCDIRKFFASIDHRILMRIMERNIHDQDILWLLGRVVESFTSGTEGKGLPLGNLTSQLLVNIYMNEFDQFMKHKLKARYYIRYADDFVILSDSRKELAQTYQYIDRFLSEHLMLDLHPTKCFIKTYASGVDFLGWVHFPDRRVLRTTGKRRMLRRLKETEGKEESMQSYLGLLKHGNTQKLRQKVIDKHHASISA